MTKILIFAAGRRDRVGAAPGPRAQGAPAGDAAKGAQKIQMCPGCHGIDGWRTAFPEVYQRAEDRRPARGLHRQGAAGSTRAASAAIRRCARSRRRCPTQDMADLAAYYAQGGAEDGEQMMMDRRLLADRLRCSRRSARRAGAAAADLEAGKAKAKEVCQACHGIDGNSPIAGLSRSSAASIPTTSRRRCATTSPARARTRSWPGSRGALSTQDIDNLAAYYALAAGGVSRASTDAALRSAATRLQRRSSRYRCRARHAR